MVFLLLCLFVQEDIEYYVSVRHATLKKEPRQFSDNLRPLYYGKTIKKISFEEYWVRTRLETDGFIHASAIRPHLHIATTIEWDEKFEQVLRQDLPKEYSAIEEKIEKSYEHKYIRQELERRVSVFKSNGRLK